MACSPSDIISADKFSQVFVDETPVFDIDIMRDITAVNGWLGNVSTGTRPIGTPTEITQDRMRGVYPNVTRAWQRVSAGSCTGRPCDPPESSIGAGSDRLTFFEEQQTWTTPLRCYDQDMSVTAIREHLDFLISDILRPATTTISSYFLRKRHLQWAKKKWQMNKTMDDFTFQWVEDAQGNERFFDCSVSPTNVFKMAPQALQYQWEPLMSIGYGGKNPFTETAPFIELVTDIDTCWDLDKAGGSTGVGGVPSVASNWRFTEWGAANKYWRYGFSGQIGNFMVRTDGEQLRFNFIQDLGAGAHGSNGNRYRYEVVLPFKNIITSGAGGSPGIGREYNFDYKNACFALSQIHHKKGMELLVPDAAPVNPETPYSHRNFGGKWQWLNNDLGVDENGCAIVNKWGNKGQFGAWFKYWVRPLYTEFLQDIFHKREPMCVPEINTCNTCPALEYTTQDYNSANDPCPETEVVLTFTPVKQNLTGEYRIAANTVLCNGDNTDNGAISGVTTLGALVVLLNAEPILSGLGTWAVSGSDITLTGISCGTAIVPFES